MWLISFYFLIINLDVLSLPVQSFIKQVDGSDRDSRFFPAKSRSRDQLYERETSKYAYAYGLRWARGYPRGLLGNLTRLWPASVGPAAPSPATPKGGAEWRPSCTLKDSLARPASTATHPVTIGSTGSSLPLVIRDEGGGEGAYTANLSRCNVIFLRSRAETRDRVTQLWPTQDYNGT